jgi:hypothetical protein
MEGQSNTQYEPQDAAKDSKLLRPVRSTREDKKIVEPNEVKQSRPQKMMDFRNIKISQVGIYCMQIPFFIYNLVLVIHDMIKQ